MQAAGRGGTLRKFTSRQKILTMPPLVCPKCRAMFQVPDDTTASKARCCRPSCRHVFPIAENTVETCTNCNRAIGEDETPYVHSQKVVCEQCYEEFTGSKEQGERLIRRWLVTNRKTTTWQLNFRLYACLGRYRMTVEDKDAEETDWDKPVTSVSEAYEHVVRFLTAIVHPPLPIPTNTEEYGFRTLKGFDAVEISVATATKREPALFSQMWVDGPRIMHRFHRDPETLHACSGEPHVLWDGAKAANESLADEPRDSGHTADGSATDDVPPESSHSAQRHWTRCRNGGDHLATKILEANLFTGIDRTKVFAAAFSKKAKLHLEAREIVADIVEAFLELATLVGVAERYDAIQIQQKGSIQETTYIMLSYNHALNVVMYVCEGKTIDGVQKKSLSQQELAYAIANEISQLNAKYSHSKAHLFRSMPNTSGTIMVLALAKRQTRLVRRFLKAVRKYWPLEAEFLDSH